jgi:hypothetical protein
MGKKQDTISKLTRAREDNWRHGSRREHLSRKCKALSSNTSTAKKKELNECSGVGEIFATHIPLLKNSDAEYIT